MTLLTVFMDHNKIIYCDQNVIIFRPILLFVIYSTASDSDLESRSSFTNKPLVETSYN